MESQLKIIQPQILNWALQRPVFLDVRAPVEFQQGHLPGAFNFPILNDEERALVGTCYKKQGQEAAIQLGHQLVSGPIKNERVQQWQSFIANNPGAILYCFRGGLRSRTAQKWLLDIGVQIHRLEGGYKEARTQILHQLHELIHKQKIILISGPTGSGKTHFLKSLSDLWPQLDLEDIAKHKGSAFGRLQVSQPSQVVFENEMVFEWLKQQHKEENKILPLALEDESRLIGRIAIPEALFSQMRKSKVVWLEVDINARVSQIFYDYIEKSEIVQSQDEKLGEAIFFGFKKSLLDIQKRLGGARTSEIMSDLQDSQGLWLSSKRRGGTLDIESNRVWIKKLLMYYYDPMYLGSLEKRNPQIYFKGSPDEARLFLLEEKNKIKANPVSKKAPTD